MILAGDIGGTHTRLALLEKGVLKKEKKFSSRQYQNLEEIVKEFLAGLKEKVAKACFGIAGPVRKQRCQATNLPWVVDAEKLGKELYIPWVRLLNDLEANAYGIYAISPSDFFLLQKGAEKSEGNQALISAGTGLGEAGLFWDGKKHRPFASEGGHADFAPRNEEEIALLQFLQKQFDHVSYERLVSGPGLYSIYQFLTLTGKEKVNPSVEAEMKGQDPSFVITKQAREKKDPACIRSVSWFISLYGAEAGNLALKFLSLGGMFIGGGIAPILLEEMKKGDFLKAFSDKGRFKELLQTIPIRVILNDSAALLGAGYFAEHS